MKQNIVIDALRFLLVLLFAFILLVQLLLLPQLAADMAVDLPAEAYMRWPMLIFSITGLACIQAICVCTLVLLGRTRADKVFGSNAVRWVDGIIISLCVGAAVCLMTAFHNWFTVSGPPLWMLLLLMGTIVGVALALLMLVMRRLLVQATTLRTELDVVI